MALETQKIKWIYTVYFLFLFAWTILFQFFPVLTVEKFSFTSSNIGDLALFMGVCWAIGSGYLSKMLIRHFDAMKILEVCLVSFAILCGLVIFPTHIYGVILILGLCVILGGLAWPLCTGVISNTAPQNMQGKILGVSQSIQSLAMTLGPVFGGIAFRSSLSLPFLLAAGISCVAVIISYCFLLKHR
jgi:predicted MFS family arabinose efflux permease